MKILLIILCALIGAPLGAFQWQPVESPAAPGSSAPGLAEDHTGGIIMTWLEPTAEGHAFRLARFTGDGFDEPRTITTGRDWFANWADTPALIVLPNGDWVAHWLQKSARSVYAYDIRLVRSRDRGRTWAGPLSPHRDGTPTEHGFVSYYPHGQASVGLVWLDGRNTVMQQGDGSEGGAMSLRTAVIGPGGSLQQQSMLDERVCDCCSTAVTMTQSGPLVAYRDRSADEIRDIAVIRGLGGRWSNPRMVHEDGWRIAGCPVNGPALAARGERVAAAWFTMAEATPVVRLALSGDGGLSFALAQSFSAGTALGRVGLVAHEHGWVLSWLDQVGATGVIKLASLDHEGDLRWQHRVVAVDSGRISGIPRLAPLAPGRVLLAWTAVAGGQSVVRAATVSLSDG